MARGDGRTRGRSFSELGWPPPMQLANSRTRRVNCTTTYVPRRRRNAATMMPSSHEITRDMSRHDIPLAGDPAGPRKRARSHRVRPRRKELPYTGWSPCAQEHGSRHSFTCVASTALSSPYIVYRSRCRSSPAIRIDLLFLVNLDRLRIDDSPKESIALHLDRSILSFFYFGPIRLHSTGGYTFLRMCVLILRDSNGNILARTCWRWAFLLRWQEFYFLDKIIPLSE